MVTKLHFENAVWSKHKLELVILVYLLLIHLPYLFGVLYMEQECSFFVILPVQFKTLIAVSQGCERFMITTPLIGTNDAL